MDGSLFVSNGCNHLEKILILKINLGKFAIIYLFFIFLIHHIQNTVSVDLVAGGPVDCNYLHVELTVPGDSTDLPLPSQSSPRHYRDWSRT